MTFWRPVISKSNAAPNAMIGAMRPSMTSSPEVGSVMPHNRRSKRRLAGAVAPDDADGLAPPHLEIDVPQHPVFLIKAVKTAKQHLLYLVGAAGIELVGLAQSHAFHDQVR